MVCDVNSTLIDEPILSDLCVILNYFVVMVAAGVSIVYVIQKMMKFELT